MVTKEVITSFHNDKHRLDWLHCIKDYKPIIYKKDDMEPEEELVKDVLQLMNVFVAKMNGLRKYKKKAK